MGKEFIKLLEQIVSPGKTWGCWTRKALSTVLAASVGVVGFNAYEGLQRSHWEDLPLHTAISKNDIANRVQLYLDGLIRADQNLKSVWIYSWPDARSLIPVAHAGYHVNPLPLGYFWVADYKEVGQLVMEKCTQLNRDLHLVACPIMAENDAWGVVIFELKAEKIDHWRSIYQALTHKLSHIIYHNHD